MNFREESRKINFKEVKAYAVDEKRKIKKIIAVQEAKKKRKTTHDTDNDAEDLQQRQKRYKI